MNHIYLIRLLVLKRPVFQTQKYGIPTLKVYILQAASILPNGTKTVLKLFCQ